MDRDRLKRIAECLRQDYEAVRIWLFRSMARGTADEDSDVDLLIVSPTQGFFGRLATVQRLLREHRGALAVAPVVLTPEELEARLAKGDQFIGDIVTHGVEL